jgi:polygalacturonase
MMRALRLSRSAVVVVCILLCGPVVQAQGPTAQPYTMTTAAGGLVPTTYTAGTTLCPGSTTVKTTTAYGDGCAAIAATFGAAGRGGVAVDSFGNVFVADDVNKIAHTIDAETGLISVLAGGGTACTAKVDTLGDGCVAATQTSFSAASALRGLGIDPYGNVILAGYNDNAIHIVCRAASPLCTSSAPTTTSASPSLTQVGNMGLVAGCMASTTGVGTAGAGLDNKPGFSTSTNTLAAFKNAGTCSTSLGETSGPRGATADLYGNVYYADTGTSRTRVVLGPLTSSYFSGNNPLYAALKTHWATPVAGYVYTVFNLAGTSTSNSTAATTPGASCTDTGSGTTYTGAATDVRGDGCPYSVSSVNASSGNTNAVATDAAGNMVITDPGNGSAIYGGLRVLYVQGFATAAAAATAGATGSVATAGVAMYNAIVKNNVGVTPQAGFVYALAGGSGLQTSASGTAPSTTPLLGNSAKIVDSTITRLTVSPQGNIYIGDNTKVLFYDIVNGTIRVLLSSSGAASTVGSSCHGTTGAVARSIYGDGCPASGLAPYAEFGNSNGLSVAVDGLNNLYMYDGTSYGSGMLVRKVLAQGTGVQANATLAALATVTAAQPLQLLGSAQTQTLQVHFPTATAATDTLAASVNAGTSYTSACTWYNTVDNSEDCNVTVSDTPAAAGPQSGAITVTSAGGGSFTLNLAGTVMGSVLATDGATLGGAALQNTAALFSGKAPAAVAVDGAGNVYAASGSSILESVAGATASSVTLATGLSPAPTKIAVDPAGDIFYLNGTAKVQELAVTAAGTPGTYSATSIAYTPSGLGTASPAAIAVDGLGDLFVVDEQSSAGTIYKLSLAAIGTNTQANCAYPATASTAATPTLCQSTVYNVGGFGVVGALTVDPSGNFYVADATAGVVYKLTAAVDQTSADTTYKQFVYTESTALAAPAAAIAVDAAGDLYAQTASTAAGVVEYPLSGATAAGVTVLPSVTTPAGIGLDGAGNLYSADASATAVTQVQRGAIVANFASSQTTQFAGTLTNVGNQVSTRQASTATSGAQAGDFTLAGTSSNGCTFTNNLLNAETAGQACGLTASFPALGNTQETDYILFAPTAPTVSTAGLLTLTGLANTEAFNTTTTLGAPTPTSPVYSPTGTETSFTITVTASSTSTDGVATNNMMGPTTSNYVVVSVDGGAGTNYNFTAANGLSASLTLNLSGLAAGNHAVMVTFPQQGELVTSSATTGTITVTQLGTAVTWTPGATTQQVSAALGTSVLNAQESPAIAGTFVYATSAIPCTATTAATVDASSYLAIGSYTLYVAFCPTDAVDYTPSMSSAAYSVTKAATTAAVGASTMVIAPSGANFTTLTSALQALPVTGGAIYLAPGTYPGQNAISYPAVQLRGLGGDPTAVIVTGENGAFTTTIPAGFGLGPVGKGGDEGSATLDISKSAFMGTQAVASTYTPNNFYAEYLTIQNTYNTDANNTTMTTATSNGGTCSTGTTSSTLQALYNNNQECGSQALALYINSDGAVLNNVNLLSQQDTLYASSIGCGTYCTVAREYIWKGTISGDVDYVFGDAALVFDHTSFFTTWHGLAPTGQNTIEAQNKRFATGTTSTTNSSSSTSTDYLSGFVCNGCNLLSQSTGMTNLYYGRPYDISASSYPSSYSTWVMLNSRVDQVNPKGWIGFDGGSEYLSTSTYAEYNTQPLVDPVVGTSPYPAALYNSTPSLLYTNDLTNATGSSLIPTGGNTGSYGVTAASATPANREPYALSFTAAQAVPWFPVNFLSTSVPATKLAAGQAATWNPVNALAAQVNSFVPTGSVGAIAYGGSVTILGRPQTPGAGIVPTGTYAFYDSLNKNQVCAAASSGCSALASGSLDASGEAYLITSSLAAGTHYVTMVYGGDANFSGSSSATYSAYVLAPGQVATTTTLTVANTSSTTGTTVTGSVSVAPNTAPGSVAIVLDGATTTTCMLVNGGCSFSLSGLSAGAHTLYASYAGNASYGLSQSATTGLSVSTPVATGDTRTVTEPTLPAVCSQLSAALTTDPAIQDLDASVDATTSNIDGARIQAALNACSQQGTASNTNVALELSMDATGTYNAFLAGPLSMPSNVTLLVDPAVTLYFSRNVQDYDKVQGTHTCGTINAASNTSSCSPLIDIPATSTNVGIMGFGKLNGRGADALLNGFATSGYAPPATYTWWNLASQANGEGNQQVPRFVQMETGSSNITMYKISILNSPNFHVSTTGAVSNFTAWDVKIVTPTSARNTDGIDPANVKNATITNSWISDGDDNIAVSAPGTAAAANISVTHNHFFAGHGESIGSYTSGGVSNVLFDNNVSAGNGYASTGSATLTGTADGNSTAIRIKTANDRGGLVTGIQYSNSCFLDHKTDIQFTPYYSSGDTTLFPNYQGILLQNLIFSNDASSQGSVEITGEFNTNNGMPITNLTMVTLDNVTFPATLSSLANSTTPVETSSVWPNGNSSGGVGQYAAVTAGPGQVSSSFLTAYNALVANTANNDTLTNNISLSSLDAPLCTYTYLAPELTGPKGVAQTLPYGTEATVDVILTPAVGGAPYPTGTAILTDALSGNTFSGTFNGMADTISVTVPVSDLTLGAHTFSVTSYSGDANYTVASAFGAYTVTVVKATPVVTAAPTAGAITLGQALSSSTLSGGTASVVGTFAFTSPATVPAVGTSQQSVTFTPTDTVDYYTTTVMVSVMVKQATPTIVLTSSPNPSVLSNAITLTATVKSSAGTPMGMITFYNGSTSLGAVTLPTNTLSVTTLPVGASTLTAVYSGDGNFITATSAAVVQQVYDFTLAATTAAQTVMPGGTATYSFTITPGSPAFLMAVNLSVSGLPTGTIYSITPTTVAAGSGATTITLTANVPAYASNQIPARPFGWPQAPFVLALVVLPFSKRMRRSGRGLVLSVLLVLTASLAVGALSGCNAASSSSSQTPQTYTVVLTGTSGTLAHSANVMLTVQ